MDDKSHLPQRDLELPFRTIGEIIGLQNEKTAEGAAFRRRLQLRFKSADEFISLPLRDQYLWYVAAYNDVVQNGGIHEFMLRSAGDCAPETLEALEAIGAQSAAFGLRRVLDLFPGKMPSRDQAERSEQIDEICASVPEISGSQDPYLDSVVTFDISEDLFALLMDYWHRQDGQPN